MAHVGQECALGLIGRLGGVRGLCQFGGALVYQGLQVLLVLTQCQFGLFAAPILVDQGHQQG